jgi:hypothetical protein
MVRSALYMGTTTPTVGLLFVIEDFSSSRQFACVVHGPELRRAQSPFADCRWLDVPAVRFVTTREEAETDIKLQ